MKAKGGRQTSGGRKPANVVQTPQTSPLIGDGRSLLADVRTMIVAARADVARTVNSTVARLYWKIGQRIRRDILGRKRAAYGQQILETLSQELSAEFGKGFSGSNLSRMMALAEAFPEEKTFVALSQELGWSHFVALLPLNQPLQRDFYAQMCRVEGIRRAECRYTGHAKQAARDAAGKDK